MRTSSIIIPLIMQVVRTSETSVYANDTTRCYVPENCHLHTRCREDMTSHTAPGIVYPELKLRALELYSSAAANDEI
jgi:hypothetical protein